VAGCSGRQIDRYDLTYYLPRHNRSRFYNPGVEVVGRVAQIACRGGIPVGVWGGTDAYGSVMGKTTADRQMLLGGLD
jgi:hypothetical protein